MAISKIIELLSELTNKESGVYISTSTPTTPATGRYFTSVVATADSVVTLVGNISDATSVSIKAGVKITGVFTSITVTSGSVVAYQGGR